MTIGHNSKAAITAELEEVKPVKTRKVLQIVCEVPMESADAALEALGGFPIPGQSRPVAIALLKPTATRTGEPDHGPVGPSLAEAIDAMTPTEAPAETERPKGGERERRDWDDVPPTEQAGIRCNEPLFQTWLHAYLGGDDPEFPADQAVRNYCGVKSRRELNTDPEAAEHWRSLDEKYQDFVGHQRYQAQLASGPS